MTVIRVEIVNIDPMLNVYILNQKNRKKLDDTEN